MRPVAAFLLLALALAVAGCGSAEEARPLPEGVTGEAPPPAETEPAPEEPQEPEESEGDAEAGAEVFATAGCGSCHVLADAGTSGTVGPSLDEAQPTFDATVQIVTEGGTVMPSFADRLTEQQIRDVSAYVAESTR